MTFRASSDWFWILFHTEFLPYWQRHQLWFPVPNTTPKPGLLGLQRDQANLQDEDRGAQVHLRLATCNVFSLCGRHDDSKCGLQGPARQKMLLRQLHEENITIFALQEARLRRLHCAHSEHYFLFRSAPIDRGHYGILIGLSQTATFATTIFGRPHQFKFKEDYFAVVAQTPRLLILRVSAPATRCILIAGHSPHSGNSAEEIDTWRESISAAIPKDYEV